MFISYCVDPNFEYVLQKYKLQIIQMRIEIPAEIKFKAKNESPQSHLLRLIFKNNFPSEKKI